MQSSNITYNRYGCLLNANNEAVSANENKTNSKQKKQAKLKANMKLFIANNTDKPSFYDKLIQPVPEKMVATTQHHPKKNEQKERNNRYRLPKGWVMMKGDKNHPGNITTTINPIWNKKPRNDSELVELCNRYQKFRSNYITEYGTETYNKMFMFPNHDYHYFKRSPEENTYRNTEKKMYHDDYNKEYLPYIVTEYGAAVDNNMRNNELNNDYYNSHLGVITELNNDEFDTEFDDTIIYGNNNKFMYA